METSRPDAGEDDTTPLRVAKGTVVLALVHGRAESARLAVGGEDQGMEVLDPHSLRASMVVKSDGVLSVRADGQTLLHRPLEMLPDDPPSVRFAAAPGSDPRGRLVLVLAARDDHGVVSLGVDLRPLTPRRSDPEGALTQDFPPPDAQTRDVISRAAPDLTAHRWAGREVRLTPWAVDALGQRAQGESVSVTLPRRVFRHPVARALISERERLTEDPGALPGVISRLDSLTARPEAFDHTLSVYLALRVARSHLAGHGRGADVERVRDLLWDAAVRVEEGDDARVVADLEALRERVQEALNGTLGQDDLDRLIRDAREALNQALADLQRSLQALDPEGLLHRDLGQDDEAMDLDQLLRDLQDMNRLGARDATRTLLEHLSDALAALHPQHLTPEALQTLRQTLEQTRALDALRRDQAALLDETFRAEQTHQPQIDPPGTQGLDARLGELRRGDRLSLPSAKAPPRPEGQSRPLAQRQQDVQGRLEQILRDIAEKTDHVPPALGEAALAMGEAVARLKAGALAAAQEDQRIALDRLSEGQAQARSQMRRALGLPLMPRMGQRGPGLDPLGRETGGLGPGTDTVGMPDRSEARRARDILEELRRRANDPQRSAPEKAYIDRLIPRF
ncbi:DUF4175 family protein [Pararhodospirillum photometricum]|uniref:DUF4175 domain-containing protein n=1 Tax=Pararhodospirillum photometricum DSM 122 TaxID=1150469 RepID=H6SIT2_PARPM|nr:DUF4175 family protein [Pararhodospirillum photometricum]CCG06709.1 Putative uncharacterized protein [Pararhodospirillum photometricum DSM 122]